MSEGELKKRIRETGVRYHPEDGAWENKENPDYFDAKTVFKVLDEAAKEFPLKRLEQAQEDICALESVENHILIWFKKWLPH